MKRIFYLIFFYVSILSVCYSGEKLPRTTLTLTYVNNSNDMLSYAGAIDTNPENIFLVSPKTILPGKTVTITSVSNNYNVPDLSGNLQFEDSHGTLHMIHITDPRQMHVGLHTNFSPMNSLVRKNENTLQLTANIIASNKLTLTHELML